MAQHLKPSGAHPAQPMHGFHTGPHLLHEYSLKKFKEWSRLKINLGKTYLTSFGKQHKKPKFVDELEIKWCVEFKLLGIYFDAILSKMHINYDKAIELVRKELSLWRHRFFSEPG